MSRPAPPAWKGRPVIFDLDGVIVDSEPHHRRAFHAVLGELGYSLGHGMRFEDYLGRADYEMWRDFVARHQPPLTVGELIARKRRKLIDIMRTIQPVFPGLPDLVAELAEHHALAVASGSEHLVIEAALSIRGLRRFFGAVVSASDVGRGKPAPDIFLRTAELLRVPAGECWVIEDSKPGIAAGLAAGMRVIAIANTHPPEELRQATWVVKTYRQIGRILRGDREKNGAGATA